MSDAASEAKAVRELMEARARDPRAVWGLPYFLNGLNNLTGGAHPGEMSIVAARPGVGKSFFLGQDAVFKAGHLLTPEGQAHYPDGCIKLVLCEMSALQFTFRMVCQASRLSMRQVMSGRLTPEQRRKFEWGSQKIAALPISYLDTPVSLSETLRWLQAPDPQGRKTSWWGVDYIGIHPAGDKQLETEPYRKVSYLSEGFRAFAKNGPPGLVLAQLNRDLEKRKPEDRRMQLSDLRDSGRLEQDASGFIGGLYRPDMYTKCPEGETNRPKQAELTIIKQRNLLLGTVELAWVPTLPGFMDQSELMDELEVA